jgi:hypothetical protein
MKYNKIYISVIMESTVQTLFAVAIIHSWFVKQINFITAFLNRVLLENKMVYTIQLVEYKQESDLVCKLNQGLYSLKQAVKIWYDTLTKLLKSLGFAPSK